MNDSELIGTRGEVLQVLLDDLHAPRLLPYVHPVYDVSGGGEPDALASCVLLRRKRDLYLATAAHVLEDHQPATSRDATTLYLGGRDGEFHALEAEFLTNKKPLDLAVARLTGSLAAAWDLYPALDVDSQLAAGETTGLHFLLGYPIRRKAFNLDRARNVIRHEAYKYAQVRSPHKKDDEHHFSMLMPRGNVKSGNKKQTAAFPRGVSGGGVFLLDGPQPMLAGIFIEYQRGERLVATKANRIVPLL
jgi:hypothetical protein